jgi:hypothetical protein
LIHHAGLAGQLSVFPKVLPSRPLVDRLAAIGADAIR